MSSSVNIILFIYVYYYVLNKDSIWYWNTFFSSNSLCKFTVINIMVIMFIYYRLLETVNCSKITFFKNKSFQLKHKTLADILKIRIVTPAWCFTLCFTKMNFNSHILRHKKLMNRALYELHFKYILDNRKKDVTSLSHSCVHGGWSRGDAYSTRALIKHAGVMVQWTRNSLSSLMMMMWPLQCRPIRELLYYLQHCGDEKKENEAKRDT